MFAVIILPAKSRAILANSHTAPIAICSPWVTITAKILQRAIIFGWRSTLDGFSSYHCCPDVRPHNPATAAACSRTDD
jgi:hypothetical protein